MEQNNEFLGDVYHFQDGAFRFWTAYYGSWAQDRRIVFRVRIDDTPEHRAEVKGIKFYDRLLPSFPNQRMVWLEGHPDYPIIPDDVPEVQA